MDRRAIEELTAKNAWNTKFRQSFFAFCIAMLKIFAACASLVIGVTGVYVADPSVIPAKAGIQGGWMCGAGVRKARMDTGVRRYDRAGIFRFMS